MVFLSKFRKHPSHSLHCGSWFHGNLPIGGVEVEEILDALFKTSTLWKCGKSIYINSLNTIDELSKCCSQL